MSNGRAGKTTRAHGPVASSSSSSSSSSCTGIGSSSSGPSGPATTNLERVLAQCAGFEDELDCPLCLDEMDLSDFNFRPCSCGYQICRFCYHTITSTLNRRCPACRAEYDASQIAFGVRTGDDDKKRLKAAQIVRNERRELEEERLRTRAKVRVRHRTRVLVEGCSPDESLEDLTAQYSAYGSVAFVRLVPSADSVDLHVQYSSADEATLCIAAVDKAERWTTSYCPWFLRGVSCMNDACGRAHAEGDEVALPPSSTPTTTHARLALPPLEKQVRLPPTASWATKGAAQLPTIVFDETLPPLSATLKPPPPSRAPKSRAKRRANPTPPRSCRPDSPPHNLLERSPAEEEPTQLELDERYARALALQFAREACDVHRPAMPPPEPPSPTPATTEPISPSPRRRHHKSPQTLLPRALPPHLASLPFAPAALPPLTRSQRKRMARGGRGHRALEDLDGVADELEDRGGQASQHSSRALPPHLPSPPQTTSRAPTSAPHPPPPNSDPTRTELDDAPPTPKRPPRRRGGVKHRSAAAKLAARLALPPAPLSSSLPPSLPPTSSSSSTLALQSLPHHKSGIAPAPLPPPPLPTPVQTRNERISSALA